MGSSTDLSDPWPCWLLRPIKTSTRPSTTARSIPLLKPTTRPRAGGGCYVERSDVRSFRGYDIATVRLRDFSRDDVRRLTASFLLERTGPLPAGLEKSRRRRMAVVGCRLGCPGDVLPKQGLSGDCSRSPRPRSLHPDCRRTRHGHPCGRCVRGCQKK